MFGQHTNNIRKKRLKQQRIRLGYYMMSECPTKRPDQICPKMTTYPRQTLKAFEPQYIVVRTNNKKENYLNLI